MRRLFIIFMLLLVSTGFAQTTLSPGDLIIVTVNSDASSDDTFDFVPLVDLEAGTEIYFTDNAWDGASLSTSEGTIQYIAPGAVTAGTVISYPGSNTNGFNETEPGFNPAGGGDNLLVFQGTQENPSFIYGIGWAISSPWRTTGAVTTNDSYIPSELSASHYNLVTLGTLDNYQYNTANGTTANAVDLLALISDVNNWNGNDVTIYTVLLATFTITSVNNLASHLVIAELYVGGGNAGATYTNDYVVIYNPTGSSIDVSNYSVQYESSTGDWAVINKVDLTGSIAAGGYYLIEGSGGANGVPIPVTPNVSGTMPLSTSGGKIALVTNQVNISGSTDPDVIDFIGYGDANEFEGTAMYAPGDNASSLRRRDNSGFKTYGTNGNGYDTDNNKLDFYIETDIATNQPLPVELTSFTANVFDGKVNLRWATATEVDNYGFEIERQKLGDRSKESEAIWNNIGFVEGHGNSNSPKQYTYTDEITQPGTYSYRLKQIDTDGSFEYSGTVTISAEDIIPDKFDLFQNYPNPFNPVTKIKYSIPSEAKQSLNATLKVYDIIGREVAVLVNEQKEPGVYEVTFDASKLSSGLYFYSLSAAGKTITKKMMLLR